MPVKMIATKPMTYGTRRLKKGREFEANERDARTLKAIGKAEYATRMMTAAKPAPDPTPAPVASPASVSAVSTDDTSALRAAYEAKLGKRPFMGWDAATLKAKIAEAE